MPQYPFNKSKIIYLSDLPFTIPADFTADNCVVAIGAGQAGFHGKDDYTSGRGGDGGECAVSFAALNLAAGNVISGQIGNGGINKGQAGGDTILYGNDGKPIVWARGGGSKTPTSSGQFIYKGGQGSTNKYRLDCTEANAGKLLLNEIPSTLCGGGGGGGSGSMFGPGGNGSDTNTGTGGAWGCAGGAACFSNPDIDGDFQWLNAPGKWWMDAGYDPMFIGSGGNLSKAFIELNGLGSRILTFPGAELPNAIPGQGGTVGVCEGFGQVFYYPFIQYAFAPLDASLANIKGTGGISANYCGGGGAGAPGGNYGVLAFPNIHWQIFSTPDCGGYYVLAGQAFQFPAGDGARPGGGGGGAGGYMYGQDAYLNSQVDSGAISPPRWDGQLNFPMPNTETTNPALIDGTHSNGQAQVLTFPGSLSIVPQTIGGTEGKGGDGAIMLMWNTSETLTQFPWQRLGFRITPYPNEVIT